MAVQVFIDGTERTTYVLSGSVTPRLNRPATATVRLPLSFAIGGAGSRLKVVDDGNLIFHGFVMTVSDEGDEDRLYTEYVASDPMEMWQWRPARDGPDGTPSDPGDFSNPSFMQRNWPDPTTGPEIMYEILNQSINGTVPTDAEGPLFINLDGPFEGGGVDMSGAPVDWPMTIAEIANLLTSTGEVDIVLTPIDSGGAMASVAVYNGDYGTDRSGSVVFQYATGAFNARAIRRVVDMSNVCNKLWYYLAPRRGAQRWDGSITGDSNYWTNTDFQGIDMAAEYPGAPDVLWRAALSRGTYGVRMDIHIHEARGDESSARFLFNRQWLMESWIRAEPREMVHITPVRGTPLNFGIGDLIGVGAGVKVRGGFSGAQRVYSFTYSWDEDGVTEITDITTSPSGEGAP